MRDAPRLSSVGFFVSTKGRRKEGNKTHVDKVYVFSFRSCLYKQALLVNKAFYLECGKSSSVLSVCVEKEGK